MRRFDGEKSKGKNNGLAVSFAFRFFSAGIPAIYSVLFPWIRWKRVGGEVPVD